MNDKPLYTLIPNKALDALIQKNHANADIVVYQILCRHYNLEDNKCWPSMGTIARLVGSNRRNVTRSLNTLCSSGMVLRTKARLSNNSFENNSYYLPHLVSFQIEKLLSEKKSAKNNKKISELKNLEIFLLKSIDEYRGGVNMTPGSVNTPLPSVKKTKGGVNVPSGVVSPSPTNNTTINTTINITKNVTTKNVSKRGSSPERIGDIVSPFLDSFSNMKKESLVNELVEKLSDENSRSYFRKIVTLLPEEVVYKCLSLTTETEQITGIRKSKGAVFTDHIKREAQHRGIEI